MTNSLQTVILRDDMLNELVQTRISKQLKAAFEEAAQREGRPASEILRLLITEWVERRHPDLVKGETGGFRPMEAGSEQQMTPTQAVSPVMCWKCHGRIDWHMELGPQGDWCCR